MALSPEARDLVVRIILAEARGEGPDGMLAVANVMKTRADSGAWGDPFSGGLTRALTGHKQFAPPLAVGSNDPAYQRAGAIADAVFSGQAGDNTGGATHFYAPSGMPGGAAPDWAVGQQGQKIGGQLFYKLPLTASNTAGTAVTGPSSVPPADSSQEARSFLASLSAHAGRPGDTANMNPEFATRLAAALRQAQAAGLPVKLMSGYRDDTVTGSKYDAGGYSSHGYGLAADIDGLDGPNGKITQAWAQIAEANGLHNPYGVGNKAEFNHWQLPSQPLEQTPVLLNALKQARSSGDWNQVWAAYQPGRTEPPTGAGVYTGPAAATSQPEPDTTNPAAPPGQGGIGLDARIPLARPQQDQGQTQAPPTPGSDKYEIIKGMTTGNASGGSNPMLYTAAKWGGG